MEKKKPSELRKKIIDAYEENEYAHVISNRNRSRSITVGTAFGGIVEVSMRGDFHNLWCTLQPVEAVELIEQLAASAGLEIAIRPRQDFASWRGWDTDADHKYWAGAANWQINQIKEAEEQKILNNQETKQLSPSNKKTNKEISEEVIRETHRFIQNDIEELRDFLNSQYENLDITDSESIVKELKEKSDQYLEKLKEDYQSIQKKNKNIHKKVREKAAKIEEEFYSEVEENSTDDQE
jgi:hypothetical protein